MVLVLLLLASVAIIVYTTAYAEYFGSEIGIYEAPYDDFGRVTYEMWRACRLV